MSDGNDGGNTRALVAAVVVIALLVGAGLWLTGALRSTADLQDCVAAGRSNCAPVSR